MAAWIFEFVADVLEQRTDLDKLEARGTVRLALKEAGLDARTVTGEQMQVMLEKVMPNEIRSRGVDDPDGVCTGIVTALKESDLESSAGEGESPESIFRRLAQG
ncbi:MAG: hypothetical protein E2O66_02005 [Deltaproteobacteria bacterium]|nr:MAG: hypothetical protein E2O66_02005 [Deltaproteobacteria bacterium]